MIGDASHRLGMPHRVWDTKLTVIAGLAPAIHHPSRESFEKRWMRGSSPRMTLSLLR
jgi:hypothetical protein